MNLPIAIPRTREVALAALRESAQNTPFNIKNSNGGGEISYSIRGWHEFNYQLIDRINQMGES